MIEIAHSLPGRLRIVVRDRRRADEVREAVAALGCVTSAALNPPTGSIVIAYDAATLPAAALWDKMCHRLAPVLNASPEVLRCDAPAPRSRVGSLADTFVDAGVRYLIERSATALLAAII